MLQIKTIESMIKSFNETHDVNIKLTTGKFAYWENVLTVELDGSTQPLADRGIKNGSAYLLEAVNKKQVYARLEALLSIAKHEALNNIAEAGNYALRIRNPFDNDYSYKAFFSWESLQTYILEYETMTGESAQANIVSLAFNLNGNIYYFHSFNNEIPELI